LLFLTGRKEEKELKNKKVKLKTNCKTRKRFLEKEREGVMKLWLCIEDGEQFVIEAETYQQAKEDAGLYNAEVIKEIKR
jgi:hypothetical protein